MWNRGSLQIQVNQIFLRLLDSLADGHGHFASLAHAESGVTLLVPDDDQGGKAEVLAAFDDLGYALDGYDLILQAIGVDLDISPDCQGFSQNVLRHRLRISTPLPGPPRPGLPLVRGTCNRRDRKRPARSRRRGYAQRFFSRSLWRLPRCFRP